MPSSGDVEDGEINDKSSRNQESKTASVEPPTGPAKSNDAKSSSEAPSDPRSEANQPEVNGATQDSSKNSSQDRQSQGRPARHDDRRPGAQLPLPPVLHALPNRPEGAIPSASAVLHHPHVPPDRPRDRQPFGHGPDYRDRPVEQRENFRARQHEPTGPRSRNRTPEPMPPLRPSRDLAREPPRADREAYERQNRPVRETRSSARQEWPDGPRDRGPDPSQGPPDRARLAPGKGPSDQQGPPREGPTDRGPWPQQPPVPDRHDRQERPGSEREPNRRYDDDRQDRPTTNRAPRHPSPRREDVASVQPRPDGRSAGTYHEERPSDYPPRDRREDYPPSGPRSDRRPEGPRRDLFGSSNPRGPYDYTPPVRQQQDPNYGRLNAVSDAPSGPRPRQPANRGRPATNGPSGRDFQVSNQVPSTPSNDRPPAFPGQGQDWRDRRGPADSQRGPEPAPAPAEAPGVHPERATFFQNKQTDVATPQAPRASGRGPSDSFNEAGSQPARNAPAPPPSGDRRDTPRHAANFNSQLQQAAKSTQLDLAADRAQAAGGNSGSRGRGVRGSFQGPNAAPQPSSSQLSAPSSSQQQQRERESGTSPQPPMRNVPSSDRPPTRPPQGYPETEYQDSGRSDGGGGRPSRHRERNGMRTSSMRLPPSSTESGAGGRSTGGGEGENEPRRSNRTTGAAPERDFGPASQDGRRRSEGAPPRGGASSQQQQQQQQQQVASGPREDTGSGSGGHHGRRRGGQQHDEYDGRGGARNGERETRQRSARGAEENRRESSGRKRARGGGGEEGAEKRPRREG